MRQGVSVAKNSRQPPPLSKGLNEREGLGLSATETPYSLLKARKKNFQQKTF